MLTVSNTEVSAHNKCENLHRYQFMLPTLSGLGIEPKLFGLALFRGIVGHAAMEAYYRNGQSVEAAVHVLKDEYQILLKHWPDAFKHQEALVELISVFQAYRSYYPTEPFRVIELETVHKVPLIEGKVDYALKLDTLIQFIEGPYRGDFAIMDHKFVYNFKSQDELKLNVQLPKYVKTLQKEGITLSKGILNQIRYRNMKDPDPAKRFQRTFLPYNAAKADRIWKEQQVTAQRIYDARHDPDYFAVRTLNDMVCKGCAYARICNIELEGRDLKNVIDLEFQPTGTFNGYGYGEAENDSE